MMDFIRTFQFVYMQLQKMSSHEPILRHLSTLIWSSQELQRRHQHLFSQYNDQPLPFLDQKFYSQHQDHIKYIDKVLHLVDSDQHHNVRNLVQNYFMFLLFTLKMQQAHLTAKEKNKAVNRFWIPGLSYGDSQGVDPLEANQVLQSKNERLLGLFKSVLHDQLPSRQIRRSFSAKLLCSEPYQSNQDHTEKKIGSCPLTNAVRLREYEPSNTQTSVKKSALYQSLIKDQPDEETAEVVQYYLSVTYRQAIEHQIRQQAYRKDNLEEQAWIEDTDDSEINNQTFKVGMYSLKKKFMKHKIKQYSKTKYDCLNL